MNRFDPEVLSTLRTVLDEAAQELRSTPATRAKMAETLVRRAAEGHVSREELKDTALQAGQTPAP